MRMRFAIVSAVLAVGLLAVLVATRATWYWFGAVALPVAATMVGYLQAHRHTCVARAKEGTFENDDGSAVPAPADEVAASRAVAKIIYRDALLTSAVLGAASLVLGRLLAL